MRWMNYITLEAEITDIGRSGMINIDFAQGDDRATDSGKEASGYKLGTPAAKQFELRTAVSTFWVHFERDINYRDPNGR